MALLLALTCNAAKTRSSKAVLLSDIQALTFYAGKDTTHRRVPAVPQARLFPTILPQVAHTLTPRTSSPALAAPPKVFTTST